MGRLDLEGVMIERTGAQWAFLEVYEMAFELGSTLILLGGNKVREIENTSAHCHFCQ